jgi:hypothetical protein
MERRFEIRKHKILQESEIKPQLFNSILKRLEQFAQPFINSLKRRERKEHAHTYIAGLLSDLKRKNTESIAYRHDLHRQGLQRFVGSVPWDHRPLLEELARQIGSQLGQDDAVIVFDPSGHKKCGKDSVGVQRQWLGRLGKVDNCQVAVYMGYPDVHRDTVVEASVPSNLFSEWTGGVVLCRMMSGRKLMFGMARKAPWFWKLPRDEWSPEPNEVGMTLQKSFW